MIKIIIVIQVKAGDVIQKNIVGWYHACMIVCATLVGLSTKEAGVTTIWLQDIYSRLAGRTVILWDICIVLECVQRPCPSSLWSSALVRISHCTSPTYRFVPTKPILLLPKTFSNSVTDFGITRSRSRPMTGIKYRAKMIGGTPTWDFDILWANLTHVRPESSPVFSYLSTDRFKFKQFFLLCMEGLGWQEKQARKLQSRNQKSTPPEE